MSERRVAMYMPDPAGRHAYDELASLLTDAKVSEPDEVGIFEIALDAEDEEEALLRIWNVVAIAGADDHIFFAEHPSLPGHWRSRSRRP